MSPERSPLSIRRSWLSAAPAIALILVCILLFGIARLQPSANAAEIGQGSLFQQLLRAVGSATVSVTNNQYISQTVEIHAGDTVTWTLIAGLHSVTADDSSFEQPLGSNWGTFSHKFDIPGEYLYYCSLHGGPNGIGMAGKVVVLEAEPTELSIFLPVISK